MSVAQTLDPRLTPARGNVAAASLRGIVPATRYVEGEARTVTAELADLKREPRQDAALDTQLLHGETLILYDEVNGWGLVQAARDGYVGYVKTDALARGVVVTTHHVRVRRTFVYPAPDMKQPIVGALPLGACVGVAGVSARFARIAAGFVFVDHLAPREKTVHDYVGVAEELIGTPYLWGGKSPAGIDCSGLVQLANSLGGRSLPRDTDMQARLGEDVSFDHSDVALMRGDLVFWKGHVGLMLDASVLLHANAYHMLVAREPLRQASDRIRVSGGGNITTVRRLTNP